MLELISAAWSCDGPRLTFHVGDLHWRLRPQPGRAPRREIRLWQSDSGKVVGFAWLDALDKGHSQCHPDANRGELEPQLLDSLEERSRAASAPSVTVGGLEGDEFRTSLLKLRGYRTTRSYTDHTQLEPGDVPNQNGVARGYSIRPSRLLDLPQQAQTITAAFGNISHETDAYLQLRQAEHYRNDLDLIAVTPEGEVGAFCLGWLDPINCVGLLEPVGCHPNHRRRGLARSVILAVLSRLFQLGAQSVVVCPRSDNSAARALYGSVGFSTVTRDYAWVRPFEDASHHSG